MLEVIIKWLIATLTPLGLFKPYVVDRTLKGVCVVNGMPVLVGLLVHGQRISFSSEIVRLDSTEVLACDTGPLPTGYACLRRFEGKHHMSISLRYDFPELSDMILRERFLWLIRLSADLYQGYAAFGVDYLVAWQPRRFEDDIEEQAS